MVGISLAQHSRKNFTTIFSENIDQSLLNKVTNKIHSTISLSVTKTKKNSGAIIPLIEDEKLSYAVIFNTNKDDDLYSLAFTIDSDNQLVLYKHIPILETLTKEFIVQIKDNIFAVKNPSVLKEMLSNVIETSNDLLLMESITNSDDLTLPLQVLCQFCKNLHIFYRSILLSEKVVIIADPKFEFNILNYPWKQFVPHRALKIVAWPKDPAKEQDFDILIINQTQKKECSLDCVKIDWEHGHVENGKNDLYLEKFFAFLKDLKHDMALELNMEINNLFKWTHEIIEICTRDKSDNVDEEIKKLIEFHSKTCYGNRLPLLTTMARKYNDYASDRIVAYFLKELGIFDKDVKRIDRKKLLSKL